MVIKLLLKIICNGFDWIELQLQILVIVVGNCDSINFFEWLPLTKFCSIPFKIVFFFLITKLLHQTNLNTL